MSVETQSSEQPKKRRRTKIIRVILIGVAMIWTVSFAIVLCWDGVLPGSSIRSEDFPRRSLDALKQDAVLIDSSSSYDDLQRIFGSPGEHQFTTKREDHIYTCMAYQIGLRYGYYTIFKDSRFSFIMERPEPFGYTDDQGNWLFKVDAQGRKVEDRRPWIVKEKIDYVLNAQPMTPTELATSISARYSAKESIWQSNLGPPVIVITALLGPLLVPSAIKTALEDQRLDELSQKLSQKYDPLKIKPGMLLAEVEALLGMPVKAKVGDSTITHLYQSPKMNEVKLWRRGIYQVSPILVEFEDGQVTQILSNDYLNPDDLNTLKSPK